VHVKVFGDSNQYFCHEACSYCGESGEVYICDCGACACMGTCHNDSMNRYRTHSDVSSCGRTLLNKPDPALKEFFCPTCHAGKKLLKAVESQERIQLNKSLVYDFASPHFTANMSGRHKGEIGRGAKDGRLERSDGNTPAYSFD